MSPFFNGISCVFIFLHYKLQILKIITYGFFSVCEAAQTKVALNSSRLFWLMEILNKNRFFSGFFYVLERTNSTKKNYLYFCHKTMYDIFFKKIFHFWSNVRKCDKLNSCYKNTTNLFSYLKCSFDNNLYFYLLVSFCFIKVNVMSKILRFVVIWSMAKCAIANWREINVKEFSQMNNVFFQLNPVIDTLNALSSGKWLYFLFAYFMCDRVSVRCAWKLSLNGWKTNYFVTGYSS